MLNRRLDDEFVINGERDIIELKYHHFNGSKDDHHDEGARDFVIQVTDECADFIRGRELRVREYTPANGGPVQNLVTVKIGLNNPRHPVALYLVQDGMATKIESEDVLNSLDSANISNIDCVVRRSWYPPKNGRPAGYTCYVVEAYFTIDTTNLKAIRNKYKFADAAPLAGGDVDGDTTDLPFNVDELFPQSV